MINTKIENIKGIDRNNVLKDLEGFPNQIEYVLNNKTILDKIVENRNYSNILVCGMGGSAISGDLLKSLFQNSISIPIFINRDYSVPRWMDENTLVVLSSYSGNTEEVLSCYNESLKMNCNPIIISSSGTLLENARSNTLQYIKVPTGLMPRLALGYSIAILTKLLNKLKILSDSDVLDLRNAIKYLYNDAKEYTEIDLKKNAAISLSLKIYDKFNIIYTSSIMEVVGLRFRAQLAENAKILSSHFTFPEQNHNEIEAFKNININNICILWVNDLDNHVKIKDRMRITSSILEEFIINEFVDLNAPTFLIRELRTIYFLDWVSFYCAIILNTDPYPIDKIKKLKSLL